MTPEQESELRRFPSGLQILVASELAAGNSIVEVGHSFPAPPAGAYVKLAKPVTTRPRVSGDEIGFYQRHSSIYSGEFSDPTRFFFVLEPPHPYLEPNSDELRKSLESQPNSPPMPAIPESGFAEDGSLPRLHEQDAEIPANDLYVESIAALQQAIIAMFKSGAYYRTSHKEGGTNIYWRGHCFVRSDFGEDPNEQTFDDKSEFLKMLSRFCGFHLNLGPVSDEMSEIDAWRSILRKLA